MEEDAKIIVFPLHISASFLPLSGRELLMLR